MTNIVLTAGRARRMGDLAPGGCKSLVELRGRPMIEWQLDVLGDAIIVCRSEHARALSKYGRVVPDDTNRGPAFALDAALGSRVDGPVTVVYADSFFDVLPSGDEWCGIGHGHGGRAWDVIKGTSIAYEEVPEGREALVCVGLYRFGDPWRLVRRVVTICSGHTNTAGMPPVLSGYPLPQVFIPSWRDVGTPEALAVAS